MCGVCHYHSAWPYAQIIDVKLAAAIHPRLFPKVHLVEGELVCPETGRKFPVRQGVPNMLLHEDGGGCVVSVVRVLCCVQVGGCVWLFTFSIGGEV